MSKGSNTTTTSQSPTALPQYQQAIGQLQNVAATPYTPYGGELTAGVNQQQQSGIGNIDQYALAGVPYMQEAAGLQENAAQPLTQQQIQQYQSPYTQDVVQATEQQMNNQNAIQQQQVLGNAAAQGALGGDRTAVAQSVLAGQQSAQEAPVIAGLENQGYTQALQTAGQQFQQNPEQAAYGIASTGQGLENAALTGANAQVGAGTLEQQTQQAQDTAAYQQFMQQQFMPESMLSWELPLLTGVGSQEGGTSSTTGPAPNPLAQYLGLGIAGLGAAGQAGGSQGIAGLAALSDKRAKENIRKIGSLNDGQHIYRFNYKGDPETRIGLLAQDVEKVNPDAVHEVNGFKHVDYDEATKSAARRYFGGRVQGLADGGVPSGFGFSPGLPGNPWLTPGQMPHGKDLPSPPKIPEQQVQTPQQMAQNAAGFSDAMKKAFPNKPAQPGAPMNIAPQVSGVGNNSLPLDAFGSMDSAVMPPTSSDTALYAHGGLVFPKTNRIQLKRGGAPVRAGLGMASFMPRRRFASGGSPDDDGDVVNFPSDRFVQPSVPAGLYNNSAGEANPLENILKFQTYGQSSPYAPAPQGDDVPLPRSRPGLADALPPEITQGTSAPQAGLGSSALAFSDDGSRNAAPVVPPDSVTSAPAESRSQEKGLLGLSPNFYQSLMAAGLGMMASRSPFLGTAIGEGGLQGLQTYSGLKKQDQDVDLKVKQLNQAAKAEQDRIAQETKRNQLEESAQKFTQTQMTPYQKATLQHQQDELERQLNAPKVMTPGQELVNPKTGETIATNDSGLMTDAAVNLAVDRIHAGDPSALQNLGRGAQTGQNLTRIQNRLAERAATEGWSGADLAAAKANFTSQSAAASTAAKRSANVDAAVEEAKQTFPLALQASAALPRSDWVPINKLEQMVQSGTSDPRYIRYNTALQGAMTAYSQAMSRTGTNSVFAQQSAHDLLAKATGHEGIQAALEQMGQEMEAAKIAPEIVRQAILSRISGKGAPAATTMPTAGAPGGQNAGVPQATTKPPAMRSNGWIYKLQPDGSYNDPSPQKG
jgi:hypothetical protein